MEATLAIPARVITEVITEPKFDGPTSLQVPTEYLEGYGSNSFSACPSHRPACFAHRTLRAGWPRGARCCTPKAPGGPAEAQPHAGIMLGVSLLTAFRAPRRGLKPLASQRAQLLGPHLQWCVPVGLLARGLETFIFHKQGRDLGPPPGEHSPTPPTHPLHGRYLPQEQVPPGVEHPHP